MGNARSGELRALAQRVADEFSAIELQRPAERIEEAPAEPDPRTALRRMTELQLETVELAPCGPNHDRARVWLAAGLGILHG